MSANSVHYGTGMCPSFKKGQHFGFLAKGSLGTDTGTVSFIFNLTSTTTLSIKLTTIVLYSVVRTGVWQWFTDSMYWSLLMVSTGKHLNVVLFCTLYFTSGSEVFYIQINWIWIQADQICPPKKKKWRNSMFVESSYRLDAFAGTSMSFAGFNTKKNFVVIKSLIWIRIRIGSGFINSLDLNPYSVNPDYKHWLYKHLYCTGRVPDPTSLFLPTSFCM